MLCCLHISRRGPQKVSSRIGAFLKRRLLVYLYICRLVDYICIFVYLLQESLSLTLSTLSFFSPSTSLTWIRFLKWQSARSRHSLCVSTYSKGKWIKAWERWAREASVDSISIPRSHRQTDRHPNIYINIIIVYKCVYSVYSVYVRV